MYLILCYLFLPHQEIRISLNATDALQPLHLVIYWGIITLSLTFSLDNKSNGNHQDPPLSTGFQFSSVRSLGCVQLFAALWTAACQASLSITNSWSLLTHVHWVSDAIQPSHALLSPSPSAFNLSQHQGLFKWVRLCVSGDQSTGASASTSVLLMNIQNWFPLGWTG